MSKVFFLLSTLSTGGGERVASDLSLVWPGNQELTLVLLHNTISYPHGGNLISLDIPDVKGVMARLKSYYRGLIKLRKLIKTEKPEYVVSFGKTPNVMNLFSGAKKSIVRVDNFYSASCHGFSGWVYRAFVKLFFNTAHAVVVISKESASDLKEHFGIKKEKLKVIYNPLNIDQIESLMMEPLEQEYISLFEKPVVITAGQLGKQKNQKKLIQAFAIVKKEVPDAQLVIMGQGPKENELKNLAHEVGLERDIHFLGWQKNPFQFIARAKVFVLSSLWEGLPCSLLEAMVCNVPVVSFDCSSGPREILAPRTDFLKKTNTIEYALYGVLVKPGDEELLAEALVKVMSDESLSNTLREKALQRTRDFDSKHIIKQWQFLEN